MEISTNSIAGFAKKSFFFSIYYRSLVSPYVFAILIFFVLYIRMCTNDSNLDGDAYFTRGEFAKALECYDEYLMFHPHHIKTLYNRGRCYDELGQHFKASVDYEQVLDRDPDNVNALVSLSKYYYRLENFEAAANLSTHAAMIDHGNFLAHYHKARACHKMGLVTDALDAYNQTISLNPDFGFAYFQRSSILISLGLHPLGCRDLQTAHALKVAGAYEVMIKYCSRNMSTQR
ncbi:MAG: tetratricopeptide repeat protein [Cytophagales bacterium]|nr:tetratricopeptide repeat protein [Cytophagales bacterium]